MEKAALSELVIRSAWIQALLQDSAFAECLWSCPCCGTASCLQHHPARGGHLWTAWYVRIWGKGAQTFCRCNAYQKPDHILWLAQITTLSLNCRFVLCHGAVPSYLKCFSLLLLFRNRMWSFSEVLTCWVRFTDFGWVCSGGTQPITFCGAHG